METKNTYQKKNLKLVTLTVNNVCNMNCPHCYLQLNKVSSDWIDNPLLKKVLASHFNHLAIVGKEPLFNQDHINKLISLAKQIKKSGKTISIVTNGKNLNLVNRELLNNLDFIDISFDGGEKTYSQFRRGDFQKLKQEIQSIYASGFKRINALNSVHSENIGNIDDMMSITKIIPFEKIMFSPYLITENFGDNKVSKISLKELFERLSSSKQFMEAKQAIVNIDSYHLQQAKLSANELIELAKEFGLKNKLVLHDKDLLHFGVVRITYDGKILSPGQSLNPKNYSEGLDLKDFKNINEAWEVLIKEKIS
jgi:sulfatase maturation enzyme AslB (radical SAM superfamily)